MAELGTSFYFTEYDLKVSEAICKYYNQFLLCYFFSFFFFFFFFFFFLSFFDIMVHII